MRVLEKKDFPTKYGGVTIEVDHMNRLCITQERRLGKEKITVPCDGNGHFEYVNYYGEEYTIWSSGRPSTLLCLQSPTRTPIWRFNS
jgi:hypothetical protein